MPKNKKYPNLSELSDHYKSRIVWRLDHRTGCGLLTAIRATKLDFGDMCIVDCFMNYGDMSERRAKYHATKVLNDSIVKA